MSLPKDIIVKISRVDIILITWVRVWYGEIVHKQANLFSRAGVNAVKIKPESEISSHNTLTSVISGLFHTGYLHTVVSILEEG